MSKSVNKTVRLLLAAMGIFFCLCGILMAVTDEYYNVKTDYGAVGNGTTNDTTAFQNALNAAGATPGGKWVFVPAGTYLISTHLNIPAGVTLKGAVQIPGSGATSSSAQLLAIEYPGYPNQTAFITLNNDSSIQGIKISYPNQTSPTANPFTPVQYPWTINAVGTNASVLDCHLLNPYQGLRIYGDGWVTVKRLIGQPLKTGLLVAYQLDACRIEDVHFWPYWSLSDSVRTWMAQNATAFVFAHSNYQYASNCFAFGYKYAYHFIDNAGSTHGKFVGCGADGTGSVGVKVDKCDLNAGGLRFSNCEYVEFPTDSGDTNCEGVTIDGAASGNVNFTNCTWWGSTNRICTVNTGTQPGTVTFNRCNFRAWDRNGTSQYAITVLGGRAIVNGCYFITEGNCVSVAAAALGATVTANVGAASAEILNSAGTKCAVANNVP
ncbi:MAG: glycosyl hydrolase family 28-related protein [Phycisphaerae bacterium]|jgi:hypothetical protein